MLAAHEVCAREAMARPVPGVDTPSLPEEGGKGRIGEWHRILRAIAILENPLADVIGHARGEGRDQGERTGDHPSSWPDRTKRKMKQG